MWAAIISALAAAFKAVAAFIGKRRDELLISLGATRQSNTDLRGRIDALQEANKIREAARADVERGTTDGVPDDDGFRRKDGDD